ncbi:hypothetical protein OROMI_028457 [Orobanche minor]
MEMEMEMEAPRKKARFANPTEDRSIYFLVNRRSGTAVREDHWYVIDIVNNDANMKDLRARKLDMQYPEVNATCLSFGSYGTLIYGFGGRVYGREAMEPASDKEDSSTFLCLKFLRSMFFYDTANPKNGWIRGPDMIATRFDLLCTHRVVDGKLYVLGGVGLSDMDNSNYPWGEYLDLSSAPSFGKWHPLDFPLSPLPYWAGPSQFPNLPIMSGEFDSDRHMLFGIGMPGDLVVCYDVRRREFSRFFGSYVLNCYTPQTLAVDGGYVFFANGSDVLAAGVFGSGSSSPDFDGYVEGMHRTCGRLPSPLPFIELNGGSLFPEITDAFTLLRIAPFKYATLWPYVDRDDEKKSTFVRLSVFTISPSSPVLVENDTHFLRTKFDVSDECLELGLHGSAYILAAVAVPLLTNQQR